MNESHSQLQRGAPLGQDSIKPGYGALLDQDVEEHSSGIRVWAVFIDQDVGAALCGYWDWDFIDEDVGGALS